MESPEEVLEFLATIPTINDGGCGIAAISFWRWVEKNCPDKLLGASIVYLYYNEEYKRLQQNETAIKLENFELIWTPPHVAILWEGYILESGAGEVTEYKLWHEVPVKLLEENLKQFWKWNGIFSRFLWLRHIEHYLDISLQEFLIPNQLQDS